MRRVGLIACYLLFMAVLGFVAVPRIVGLGRSSGTKAPAVPTLAILARATASPTLVPTPSPTPLPTDTPSPTPAPLQASPFGPNRLIIPALGINSSWVGLGFLSDGLTMASPAGPMDLGWYTFSGAPGGPSNAVFAGHVDWYTGAQAIFAGLASLGPGAVVQVSRDDGKLVVYHVVSSDWYDFLTTDASAIIAPTTKPTITLITCGGVFNQATHEYDKRLVVRAVEAE